MMDGIAETACKISKIEITNFKSIGKNISITLNERANNLIGMEQGFKKEIPAAIIFALGATANQIHKAQLGDIPNNTQNLCRVRLTLKAGSTTSSVARRIERDAQQATIEYFDIDSNVCERAEYMNHLKTFNFDLDKQIHFFDAANRKMFWNMITCDQDELLCTFTDEAQTIREMTGIDSVMRKLKVQLAEKLKNLACMEKELSKLRDTTWTADKSHYVLTSLMRDEAERKQKKAELAIVENDLDRVNINVSALREEITIAKIQNQAYGNRIAELEFRNLLQPLRGSLQNENLLTLNIKIITLKNKIARNNHLMSDKESQLPDLERYKDAAQSHIIFMTTAQLTQEGRIMITEDALKKLYPIYHGSDELAKDKLKLQLLIKEEQLNDIQVKKNIFDYYECALPQQRLKQIVDDQSIDAMFDEFNNALKGLFDPNSLLFPDDDVKFEVFRKTITKDIGFIMYDAFQPIEAEHTNLIKNILYDFKYVVVLYNNKAKYMMNKLNEQHPNWFQNVHYLVLSKMKSLFLSPRIPQFHWLHYVRFNIPDEEIRWKIVNYMILRLNIRIVPTHVRVQNEFKQNSKKYVASFDGQLIYTNVMNIDILRYFKPGEKIKELHFPEATERVTDAYKKIGELMSSSFETENIPRVSDVGNYANLEGEVTQMKMELAQRQQLQLNQMEALRRQMDEPYMVSHTQNFTQAIEEEQARLNDINEHIASLRRDIRSYRIENDVYASDIRNITEFITNQTELKEIQSEVEKISITIEKKQEDLERIEKRLHELNAKKDLLENGINNLKYRTIRAVLRGYQENGDRLVDIVAVTTPTTLLDDIVKGVYIDPKVISLEFRDNDLENQPEIDLGKQGWSNRETLVSTGLSTLKNQIDKLKKELRRQKASYTEKAEEVGVELSKINDSINLRLRVLAGFVFHDMSIQFNFEYKKRAGPAKMITISISGAIKPYESFDYNDQALIHWIVFGAFQSFAKAPFVYIDLTDVNEYIIEKIGPLISTIATHCQMFIISSHIYHIHFASFQIGVFKTIDAEASILVLDKYGDAEDNDQEDGTGQQNGTGQQPSSGQQGTDQQPSSGQQGTDQQPSSGEQVTDQQPSSGQQGTDQQPSSGQQGTDQQPSSGQQGTDQQPSSGQQGTDQQPSSGEQVTDQQPSSGQQGTDQQPSSGQQGTDQQPSSGEQVTDQQPSSGQQGTDQQPSSGEQVTDQQPSSGQQGTDQQPSSGQQGTDQQPSSGEQVTDQQPGSGQQGTDQQPSSGQQGTDQQPSSGEQVTDQQPSSGQQGTDQQPSSGEQVTDQQPSSGQQGTDQQPSSGEQVTDQQPSSGQQSPDQPAGIDQQPGNSQQQDSGQQPGTVQQAGTDQ